MDSTPVASSWALSRLARSRARSRFDSFASQNGRDWLDASAQPLSGQADPPSTQSPEDTVRSWPVEGSWRSRQSGGWLEELPAGLVVALSRQLPRPSQCERLSWLLQPALAHWAVTACTSSRPSTPAVLRSTQ